MATKDTCTPYDVARAASLDRYFSLRLETQGCDTIRNTLDSKEKQLADLKRECTQLKSALVDALVQASGLSVGDIVELRRGGNVKIVDFYLGYEALIEREILYFHYSKINTDGSVNKREKPRYNQASMIDIVWKVA